MHIETGVYGGDVLSDGSRSPAFVARAVIPLSEFHRLGLGDHERPSAIPACFRWCHARMGVGGTRWSVRLSHTGSAIVYFADRADALAFHTYWAEPATDGYRLAA